MQGWGSFGGNLGRGPPHCCASSFPAITTRLTPVHFTNICMRFEDPQKMFFPVGWPSSPPPVRGVVMTSRSSGPVYGELGEEKYHQLWTHSSQNRLPLESSLRRQRHPVATSIEDKKGEKSNHIEKVFCTLCWFWGSVGKKRRPGRASPSAARREDGSSPGGCRPATVWWYWWWLILFNNYLNNNI